MVSHSRPDVRCRAPSRPLVEVRSASRNPPQNWPGELKPQSRNSRFHEDAGNHRVDSGRTGNRERVRRDRSTDGAESLRVFDPDRLAENLELDMWQAYYRHEQSRLFLDLVTTLRERYHCSLPSAARVGFHFARAASTFSGRTTTPDQVLPDLEQGYEVVSGCVEPSSNPVAVARAEPRGGWRGARRADRRPSRSAPYRRRERAALRRAGGARAECVHSASPGWTSAGRRRRDADWTKR